MTTSNSYNWNPGLGEATLYAFQLIGIRPSSLLQEHVDSARTATNMLFARWGNEGVNLWCVDKVVVPLVAGQATYPVDSSTVVMLDAYITVGGYDRIIMPVSRSEYASYPNKNQEGQPTTFWFDRLLSPTVTLWPVPNGDQTSLSYYRVRRIQDANLAGAEEMDIPYLWLEAMIYGLAFRLAQIWAPDKAATLKPMADESYQIASSQNVEQANFYVSPTVSSYWRQ